eukprot:CAMPEP_0181516690 /NCGR_PEP_ID=MMETSP1110-20121109/64273_1 /TAXON_ID=174948 /ORGANISM="Symbiodinium sp., Strain CCMP421" /LENGTH=53 /DNA_ID=CAMNT_0023646853 /DNA_START=1 /DNA_END=158 /DNA_ORIENTATION=-
MLRRKQVRSDERWRRQVKGGVTCLASKLSSVLLLIFPKHAAAESYMSVSRATA